MIFSHIFSNYISSGLNWSSLLPVLSNGSSPFFLSSFPIFGYFSKGICGHLLLAHWKTCAPTRFTESTGLFVYGKQSIFSRARSAFPYVFSLLLPSKKMVKWRVRYVRVMIRRRRRRGRSSLRRSSVR